MQLCLWFEFEFNPPSQIICRCSSFISFCKYFIVFDLYLLFQSTTNLDPLSWTLITLGLSGSLFHVCISFKAPLLALDKLSLNSFLFCGLSRYDVSSLINLSKASFSPSVGENVLICSQGILSGSWSCASSATTPFRLLKIPSILISQQNRSDG